MSIQTTSSDQIAREDLRFRTLKKASEETGISVSSLKKLIHEKKLTKFKIKRNTLVSLTEWQELVRPQ